MKKVLFYLALVVLAASMTACDSDTLVDDLAIEQQNDQQNGNSKETRSNMEDEEEDPSRIRINMYEAIDAYNVEISNVKIMNTTGTMMTPAFGNNFNGVILSSDAYAPTYDTASGDFAFVEAGTELRLAMTFDAKLTANDGSEGVVRVKGVTIFLNENALVVESGKIYDIAVKVDAAMLNLSSVNFDASVEDWQNGNDANI